MFVLYDFTTFTHIGHVKMTEALVLTGLVRIFSSLWFESHSSPGSWGVG